jgi:nucleotide-binding universal stress UspA family protein
MYARILVGVDGSTHAEHALRHAAAVAREAGAALRIAYVVDMGLLPIAPELGVDLAQLTSARRAEGQHVLSAGVEEARKLGIAAETRLVETGTPAQSPAAALVEEAASWPADLIVLGARGRRGVERLLLGSMADGVARRSTVPVLLVP